MFQAQFIGMFDKQFHWRVTINRQVFEYHTGLGHGVDLSSREYRGLNSPFSKIRKDHPNKELFKVTTSQYAFVPKMDDVLYCLFSDSDCGDYTFKDFCDNLGYGTDSIQALKTYHACQENGYKLKLALGEKYTSEKKRIEELNL